MCKHPTRLGLPVAALLLLAMTPACEGTPEGPGCVGEGCAESDGYDSYDDGYDGYDGYDGPDGGGDADDQYDDGGHDGYDGYEPVCDVPPAEETQLLVSSDYAMPACEASGASVYSLASLDSSSRWAADAFLASRCEELICVAQRSILQTADFLSAFDFGYPAAAPGDVEIHADLIAPDDHGEFTLLFGVSSAHKNPGDVRPLHIGLVFDTSMPARSGVLDREIEAAHALAKSLRAGDYVSIAVAYADGPLLLDHYEVSGPNDATLVAALAGIDNGGSAFFNLALANLYASMEASYDPERGYQIVMLMRPSVGIFPENIEHARTATMYDAGPGIRLSAIAFPGHDYLQFEAPYDLQTSLLAATQAGQGSLILSTDEDLDGVHLGDNFVKNIDIAARDLHVDVSLPPGLALASSENGVGQIEPTDDPEHLAPNSALVRTMRLTVCDPELLSLNPSIKITAHFNDPVTLEPKTFEREFPVAALMANSSPRAVKAQALLRSLDALHKLALCDDSAVSAVDHAIEVLQDAMSQLPDDNDLSALAAQMTKPIGKFEAAN